MLATVPGLPWWGAVLTMLVFTAVGALASGEFTGANAGVLAMGAGAVVAVLAVRNRALFTAMVQPPLIIATAIPLYRWFSLPSPRKTSQILTDVLFPMISLFPWMFWTTVVVLIIGGLRFMQYRSLTATARSAQRSSASSAKGALAKATAKARAKAGGATPAAAAAAATTTGGKATKTAGAKGAQTAAATKAKPAAAAATSTASGPLKTGAPAESAGLPIGERLRSAFTRLRPAPAAGAAGAAGAAALAGDGGRSERHQNNRAAPHRSSRAVRDREDRRDARTEDRRDARADPAAPSRGRSSAARREDPRRELRRQEVVRDEQRRDSAERLARTREEIAARDAGAPATRINRVVRPDSGQHPRPPMPRRPVEDDRRAMPRGARPRPAVAQGDRPRPGFRDSQPLRRDSREIRRDEDQRRAAEQPARWRTPRQPEGGRPSGPVARTAAPADARDYRREARDIDRARGTEAPAPRPERQRSRIPRDDFGSLPRISGDRVDQPDLPSLSGDQRPSRRGETPSNPGRYEHYRPPRFRPQSEETAVETNFRDDFAEPAEEPRQIRRHRYKD